jgi:hypothetical protein
MTCTIPAASMGTRTPYTRLRLSPPQVLTSSPPSTPPMPLTTPSSARVVSKVRPCAAQSGARLNLATSYSAFGEVDVLDLPVGSAGAGASSAARVRGAAAAAPDPRSTKQRGCSYVVGCLLPGRPLVVVPLRGSWTPLKTRSPSYDGLRKAKVKTARIRAQLPDVVLAAQFRDLYGTVQSPRG